MIFMRPPQQGHGGGSWSESGAIVVIVIAMHRRGWHIEQSLTERELVGAVAVGEEAIVANAMEAVRQYVEQEASHELAGAEAHDFALATAALAIVLPAETDMGLVEIDQAAVGDGDAMRVAREIGQDLLGAGEGFFGIDDPFGCGAAAREWPQTRSPR